MMAKQDKASQIVRITLQLQITALAAACLESVLWGIS